MHKWHHIFSKSTGLSLYSWIMFCVLPFYFIFRLSAPMEITIGLVLIILFFTAYRLAFLKNGWVVHVSLIVVMAIHVGMTLYFGYVYFSLILAYYIGNSRHKVQFLSLYIVHLVITFAAVSFGFFVQLNMFLAQIPFIIITLVGVILLPLNLYHTSKQKELEDELQNANEQIARLLVAEERHRIARDLHDTLGQKLSLIGMKSDLSRKLISVHPERAIHEIKDVQHTARTALKELREIVSTMRSVKLQDEIMRVKQMLETAQIELQIEGETTLEKIPPLVENVLSMCLKETVTNVVKHSQANHCYITIEQSPGEVLIEVRDDGIGFQVDPWLEGNGLHGIRERLDFVNGQVQVTSSEQTIVRIKVPKVSMGTAVAAEENELAHTDISERNEKT